MKQKKYLLVFELGNFDFFLLFFVIFLCRLNSIIKYKFRTCHYYSKAKLFENKNLRLLFVFIKLLLCYKIVQLNNVQQCSRGFKFNCKCKIACLVQ